MWKYEKHTIQHKGAYAGEGYSKLNRLGRQGWEVYFVVVEKCAEIYYLKKEIPPNKRIKPTSEDYEKK